MKMLTGGVCVLIFINLVLNVISCVMGNQPNWFDCFSGWFLAFLYCFQFCLGVKK